MSDISYKTIAGRNFMLIPCGEAGKNIDTQLRMLTYGGLKSILPVTPTSKNGTAILQYDITGMTRLSSLTQQGKLSHSRFSLLIEGLLLAADECACCALNACGICLEEESIYLDARETAVHFAYLPTLQEGEPAERCRELLRGFIAYGKVEMNALSSAVTDAINRPSFNLILLREILEKYGVKQAAPSPALQEAPPAAPFSPASPAAPSAVSAPPTPAPFPSPVAPGAAVPAAPAQISPHLEQSAPLPAAPRAKGGKRRILILAALMLMSLALIAGVSFSPVVRLPEGGLDITRILGVAILVAAADFLVLRKLPKKEAVQPATGAGEKGKKKGEPIPAAAPSAAQPFAPPAAPLPQPPAPAAEPTVFAPPEDAGDTVMMDESLYLQTAAGEIIPLTCSPFRIGRDQAVSDYVLSDETVGRKHAELSQQGNGWVVTDQNSRNHTFRNGECLNPYTPYPLSPGDTLQIARVTLWVKGR